MISEAILAFGLIILPLSIGGVSWFRSEYHRSQSAFASFRGARQQLIQTHEGATYVVNVHGARENIILSSLEDLDQGSSGLGVSDLTAEVSQLSEDASRSLRQLQDMASSASSDPSKP